MGRRVGLVTAILLLMLCVIQPISAAYNQSKTKEIQTPDQDNLGVKVTVIVLDKNTSKPIGGALVIVRRPPVIPGLGWPVTRRGFTNSKGEVTFKLLPVIPYMIVAHKEWNGYLFDSYFGPVKDGQVIELHLEKKINTSQTGKGTPKTQPNEERNQQIIGTKPISQIIKIFRSVRLISKVFR